MPCGYSPLHVTSVQHFTVSDRGSVPYFTVLDRGSVVHFTVSYRGSVVHFSVGQRQCPNLSQCRTQTMLYTSQCRTERVITQLNYDDGQASVRIVITDIVCIKNWVLGLLYSFGMLCLVICIDIGVLSTWSFWLSTILISDGKFRGLFLKCSVGLNKMYLVFHISTYI